MKGVFVPLGLVLAIGMNLGCARGLVKEGPTGDSGKGIGLKIPMMGLGQKETYDAENLSTGNIREEALNPFQEARDVDPLSLDSR